MPTIDEILKLDACRNLYKEDVDQLRAAIESAIREARAEERRRCAEALTLAANRLERLSIEVSCANRLYYEAKEWAQDARQAAIRALKD